MSTKSLICTSFTPIINFTQLWHPFITPYRNTTINRLFSHKITPRTTKRRLFSTSTLCVLPARFHSRLYRVGQKNRTVFRLDNFVTVSPRKACSMSKFSQFYREKRYKTRISVSLNILCQICSNRHNSWNYGKYDQNTWILLNLH